MTAFSPLVLLVLAGTRPGATVPRDHIVARLARDIRHSAVCADLPVPHALIGQQSRRLGSLRRGPGGLGLLCCAGGGGAHRSRLCRRDLQRPVVDDGHQVLAVVGRCLCEELSAHLRIQRLHTIHQHEAHIPTTCAHDL